MSLAGRDSARFAITDTDDGFGMIWLSDEFMRKLALDAWRQITVRTIEFRQAGDDVYDHHFSTSFDVHAIHSRGSHELYLAGKARNDDMVVERWIIEPSDGGYATRIDPVANPSGAPFPIGTPTPVAPLVTVQAGSGSTPLQVRLANPQVQKMELYRGSAYGHAVAIAPDPDGRFVILLNDLGQLVQFDLLDDTLPPFVVADGANYWPLTEASRMIVVQHVTYGRVWFIGTSSKPGTNGEPDESTYVIFVDSDNDGVFDSDFQLDEVALLDSDFMDSSLITDQFIGY